MPTATAVAESAVRVPIFTAAPVPVDTVSAENSELVVDTFAAVIPEESESPIPISAYAPAVTVNDCRTVSVIAPTPSSNPE